MKLVIRLSIIVFFVSIFAIGCSESEKQYDDSINNGTVAKLKEQPLSVKTFVTTNEVNDFASLASGSVLIRVNGNILTKERFLNWVALRKALMKTITSNSVPETNYEDAIRDQMLTTVTNEFIRQTVASEYARQNGIKPSAKLIDLCRRGFMANARTSGQSWDIFIKIFSVQERETINDRILAEAVLGAVYDSYLTKNPVKLDDDEVRQLFAGYNDYNMRCSASNAVVWAQASNIWKRVLAGENFKKLAAQFDEDEYRTEDGVWGCFKAIEFSDEPEIWKHVHSFRVGWVSPPIEADNGLMIMRIDSVEDRKITVTSPNYVPSPEAEFTISRIFLHLPLFMEMVDEEQFKKECLTAKRTAEFNKFLSSLAAKSKIEFPCGTKIFNIPKHK